MLRREEKNKGNDKGVSGSSRPKMCVFRIIVVEQPVFVWYSLSLTVHYGEGIYNQLA